ncbi:energy transducer TonB [Colwellia psychrerythraea]|uniref:energy transducer TonB n=1 Tax=Colwellia psychrerythraea TaxID=28229 RepID=UPI0018CF8EC0|nr:energy transducer TonB [Colwellia psychrerythraea]
MSRTNLFICFLVAFFHGVILFSFNQGSIKANQQIYQPSLRGNLITSSKKVEENKTLPLIEKIKPVAATQSIVEPPPVAATQSIVEPPPVAATQSIVEPPPVAATQSILEPQSVVATQSTVEPQPVAQDDKGVSTLVLPHLNDANALSNPNPIYPRLSRRLHEEGTVLLEILILPNGSVGEMRLKASSGFTRLDQTAKATVKYWRYQPAQQNGKSIEYWYIQPVHFSLNHSKT